MDARLERAVSCMSSELASYYILRILLTIQTTDCNLDVRARHRAQSEFAFMHTSIVLFSFASPHWHGWLWI